MENINEAEHLAKNFYLEKLYLTESIMGEYTDNNTYRVLINKMNLNSEQKRILEELVSTLLTDTMYTILLGLDGAASIGDGPQESYTIYNEKGCKISECGELEAAAFAYFYEDNINKKE